MAKYVSKHILKTLNTVEKHKIKKVVECLEIRYDRGWLEKLEKVVLEWIEFREDDYDHENDVLQAIIEFQRKKE